MLLPCHQMSMQTLHFALYPNSGPHALSPNSSTEQKKVELQDRVSEYVTGSMSCSSSHSVLPLSHAHSEAFGCHHA